MSIYRFTTKATHSSAGAQYNIHHYEFPGYVPTADEAEEALQALVDAYEELLLSHITGAVTFNEMEYRRVDVGDLPTTVYIPPGWPLQGTALGSALPPQVAAVARWVGTTEFPRSARSYLQSFVAGTLDTTGAILIGPRAAVTAFAGAATTLPVTGQSDAIKVAVEYGGTPSVVVASNPVSVRPTASAWGIQRRRRPGVGI